jgi:hypothetical protein
MFSSYVKATKFYLSHISINNLEHMVSMRLKLLTATAFLFLMISNVSASTTVSDLSSSTVEPGGEFTVKVTISNPDFDRKTYKPLVLDLPDGFKVVERPEEGLKRLCGSCSDERVFRVKADSDVSSGVYTIEVEPDSSYTTGLGQHEQFIITVDGEANLVATLERPEIKLGEEADAELRIENIGTDAASEIVVEPENSKIFFQPGKLTIDQIDQGEIFRRDLTVSLEESIKSGIYTTSLDIRYKDESQEKSSKSGVSVKAVEKSNIVISNTDFGKATVGQEMDALIELENQGPGGAENISTKINCRNATIKKDRSFMGQLEEDESVPAVFEITPKEKNVICSLSVRYTDSQNKEFTETFSITAERKPTPVIPVAAILGLTAVIGFYLVRR